MTLTTRLPPTSNLVGDVVGLSAFDQVRVLTAERVVAGVPKKPRPTFVLKEEGDMVRPSRNA